MKKVTLLLISTFLLIIATNQLFAAETLVGKVVDLTEYLAGKPGDIDRAKGAELFKAKKPLGFVSNGKLYLVYNTDGSLAIRSLAVNADNKELKITGKVNNKKGFLFIIADKME